MRRTEGTMDRRRKPPDNFVAHFDDIKKRKYIHTLLATASEVTGYINVSQPLERVCSRNSR